MARYAIIEGGVAVNITEAEADYAEGKGWVLAPTARIGDLWDGSAWHTPEPPAAPVPDTITRAQGKAALIHADLMPAVQQFITSIADPKDRAMAEVTMSDAHEWRRDNAFLNAAGAAVGLTETQMDDLFRQAATIEL